MEPTLEYRTMQDLPNSQIFPCQKFSGYSIVKEYLDTELVYTLVCAVDAKYWLIIG